MAVAQQEHSPEDVETVLTYIAMHAGNVSRAHKKLEAEGHQFSYRTMADWKHRHAKRYKQIEHSVRAERKQETAERIDDLTQQQLEVMQDTLDAYKTALADGDVPPRDLSKALRDLATALGIGNQNAQLLRGEPTEIVDLGSSAIDSMRALMDGVFVDPKALQQLVLSYARLRHQAGSVDSTAEELPALPMLDFAAINRDYADFGKWFHTEITDGRTIEHPLVVRVVPGWQSSVDDEDEDEQ